MSNSSVASTPDRLITVASRMFASRGVDAVSIRSVTREAGLGPASIHYHFKTKDALLEAILERHGRLVIAEIEQRCRRLLASDVQPTAWKIVECVALPYFGLLDREPQAGAEWLQIVGQLARAQDERSQRGAGDATALLHSLVDRAFPDAAPHQRALATSVAISTLLTLLGQQNSPSRAPRPIAPHTRRLIVDFVAGGLTVAAKRVSVE